VVLGVGRVFKIREQPTDENMQGGTEYVA